MEQRLEYKVEQKCKYTMDQKCEYTMEQKIGNTMELTWNKNGTDMAYTMEQTWHTQWSRTGIQSGTEMENNEIEQTCKYKMEHT